MNLLLIVSCLESSEKDGVISDTLFWTLPQLGTPFHLNRWTVRPGSNFIQFRWSHKDLQCIGSYIVKMCQVKHTKQCSTEIVTIDNTNRYQLINMLQQKHSILLNNNLFNQFLFWYFDVNHWWIVTMYQVQHRGWSRSIYLQTTSWTSFSKQNWFWRSGKWRSSTGHHQQNLVITGSFFQSICKHNSSK